MWASTPRHYNYILIHEFRVMATLLSSTPPTASSTTNGTTPTDAIRLSLDHLGPDWSLAESSVPRTSPPPRDGQAVPVIVQYCERHQGPIPFEQEAAVTLCGACMHALILCARCYLMPFQCGACGFAAHRPATATLPRTRRTPSAPIAAAAASDSISDTAASASTSAPSTASEWQVVVAGGRAHRRPQTKPTLKKQIKRHFYYPSLLIASAIRRRNMAHSPGSCEGSSHSSVIIENAGPMDENVRQRYPAGLAKLWRSARNNTRSMS